jgi:hypothetical protein
MCENNNTLLLFFFEEGSKLPGSALRIDTCLDWRIKNMCRYARN